jgi:prepilin-type N-terminal cleavage/methylation domain-containing protein
MKLHKNTSGFTLVELVLSMTIFAVMSTAIISIYIQTTALSYKLKAARYLSETSREITERISEDVREYGMTGSTIASAYIPWNTQSYPNGVEVLGI